MSANSHAAALAGLAVAEACLRSHHPGSVFTARLGGTTGQAYVFTCGEPGCTRGDVQSTSEMERHLARRNHQRAANARLTAQQAAQAPAAAPAPVMAPAPAPVPAPVPASGPPQVPAVGGFGAQMGVNQLQQQPDNFDATTPAADGDETQEDENYDDNGPGIGSGAGASDGGFGGGFGGGRNGFRGGLFGAPTPVTFAGQPQYTFHGDASGPATAGNSRSGGAGSAGGFGGGAGDNDK